MRSAKEIASERLQTQWKTAARRASAAARGLSGGAYTRELFRAARAERAEGDAYTEEYSPAHVRPEEDDYYAEDERGAAENYPDYLDEQYAAAAREPLEDLLDSYSLGGDGAAGADGAGGGWNSLGTTGGVERTPGVAVARMGDYAPSAPLTRIGALGGAVTADGTSSTLEISSADSTRSGAVAALEPTKSSIRLRADHRRMSTEDLMGDTHTSALRDEQDAPFERGESRRDVGHAEGPVLSRSSSMQSNGISRPSSVRSIDSLAQFPHGANGTSSGIGDLSLSGISRPSSVRSIDSFAQFPHDASGTSSGIGDNDPWSRRTSVQR